MSEERDVIPLMQLDDLEVHFKGSQRREGQRQIVRAVDKVNLEVHRGRTLGIVGESGSGKSTLGRAIVGIYPHTGGVLRFKGQDVAELSKPGLRQWNKAVQMIFQDPFDALNPRMRIGTSIAEPLVAHKVGDAASRRERVLELLDLVGLEADVVDRYPHEFSGGQLQRVVIARAITINPELIVCDEPTSALDVSTQAVIVNLLKRFQAELELTYVFISHDLGVVRQVADEVAVLYGGALAEVAPADELFHRPLHPYTAGLMSAVPGEPTDADDHGRRLILEGEAHDPATKVPGCRFAPRCPFATDRCRQEDPPLAPVLDRRKVACHHWDTLAAEGALDVLGHDVAGGEPDIEVGDRR